MTDTSWGKVANWYDKMLEGDADSYQSKVVLPSLLKLMETGVEVGEISKSDKILDLACGQGFFTRALISAGAGEVVGADISSELIAIAKKNVPGVSFHIAPAHRLEFAKSGYFTRATIILALDNIHEFKETLIECARVLDDSGELYLVINHPAFRIIGESSWGYDARSHTQYRRLEAYMSESSKKIVMNPGQATRSGVGKTVSTITFHRPISEYIKALSGAGFAVINCEEWVSHKKSEPGPKTKAEDKARREFPLFLAIAAKKI